MSNGRARVVRGWRPNFPLNGAKIEKLKAVRQFSSRHTAVGVVRTGSLTELRSADGSVLRTVPSDRHHAVLCGLQTGANAVDRIRPLPQRLMRLPTDGRAGQFVADFARARQQDVAAGFGGDQTGPVRRRPPSVDRCVANICVCASWSRKPDPMAGAGHP